MKTISCILFLCVALLAQPLSSQAIIYKYVDNSGRMVFVDDASKIPSQYRQKTTAINEGKAALTTEEYADQEEDRAKQIVDRKLQNKAKHQAKQQEKRRGYQTPVVIRGNRVLVPVEIAMDNRLAHLFLLLDTGTTATIFHREALSGLNLPSGEKLKAQIAGGKTLDSEKINFEYIDIGPFHEKNFHAMVIKATGPELPYDGMLGMDFLKNHPYQINYETEIIRWDID